MDILMVCRACKKAKVSGNFRHLSQEERDKVFNRDTTILLTICPACLELHSKYMKQEFGEAI